MAQVLALNRNGSGFQSFAGVILTSEGSRKGANQLDTTRIEWTHVALFEFVRTGSRDESATA
jgi:hypothetical protein